MEIPYNNDKNKILNKINIQIPNNNDLIKNLSKLELKLYLKNLYKSKHFILFEFHQLYIIRINSRLYVTHILQNYIYLELPNKLQNCVDGWKQHREPKEDLNELNGIN